MMTSQPFLISPDGSCNRNPPERCPRALYSRDSTQEDRKMLNRYQYKRLKNIKTEMKKEEKVASLNGDIPCKEDQVPSEINTDPKEVQRNIKAEQEKERCVKATMKILEIGIDGRYRWYNMDKYPTSEIVDDDITAYVAKAKAMTPNFQPPRSKEEKPFPCPDCGKRFAREKYLIVHYRSHSGEKPFICAECGKSFTFRSSRDKHEISHTTVLAFPCSECGKRCLTRRNLASHRKVHSNEKRS